MQSSKYLRQLGLVTMQQAFSLAAEDLPLSSALALSPALTLLQMHHSCSAALQVLSLLTHPVMRDKACPRPTVIHLPPSM